MAVTLWKAEYHHLAVLEAVTGSQSLIAFCLAASSSVIFGVRVMFFFLLSLLANWFDSKAMSERLNNLGLPISSTSHRAIQSGILQLKQPQIYELWESQKPYLGEKKNILTC